MNNISLVPIEAANDPIQLYEACGSHGTCRSRAESILSEGFKTGTKGRRGDGAYLWYAESVGCEYATQLAHHWFLSSVKRREFEGDGDQSEAILWGKVSAPPDEVLNLERPEFRDILRKALARHWTTINSKDPKEKEALVCSIHQMLIQGIETTKPVGVVLATVTPPKMPDELAGYVGQPYALIVRNLSYLTIFSDIERVPS
ncbi:TPA: hypothetical protein MBF47_003828 [Klebsiella pneumoniae]|uniref:hypothetical protein n=1 Tax=Klebsiella pneumoniae TaxID=573 RepID=UPI000E2B2417|nr:hypothetical protein [Klebsiella pneumoniae]EIV9518735.1 hypothetical protein [Klebsiella pneumoniae]EKW8956170.1 hypothetical protein [Klebsiella pneumoniae]MBO8097177.1 hypothetical protein [Klebsiella pneumoniae]MBZ4045846.1 hypothetical protein [Klebsiella pneumoniae]MCQ8576985.1 hypothetical protein [Klebsiella pneumoniae]